MTTHMTKTWFEDGKLITQVVPESEIYKREWVGLTEEELDAEANTEEQAYGFVQGAIWAEAKLKEKNA